MIEIMTADDQIFIKRSDRRELARTRRPLVAPLLIGVKQEIVNIFRVDLFDFGKSDPADVDLREFFARGVDVAFPRDQKSEKVRRSSRYSPTVFLEHP